jgi:hypothetical protein
MLPCLALAASLAAHAAEPVKLEDAPRLAGAAIAPAVLLQGPLHTVGEPVAVEGFMGRFEIRSKFGKFDVSGGEMLVTRVRELAAIETLDQIEKSAEFQQALVRTAQAPVQFVGNAFTDPGATVESVVTGVGTVLGRVGRLATTGARAVGDTASDVTTGRTRTDPATATTGEPLPPTFTGDPFGFNRARRQWAQRLNIDPYTSNPVLRPMLDAAARVTFAGELPVNLTVGLVLAPLQYATTFDNVVRDSVWNTPVIDLVAQNERRLGAMGISGRPVRDFFRNRWFTPTLQTALVLALEQLKDVGGRTSVIVDAASVQGEVRARAFIRAVHMLAQQHQDAAPLSKIWMNGIAAVGKARDGKTIVAADIDYLWWNAEAKAFAARADLVAKRRLLLVSGIVSPTAEEALTRERWEVRSRLRPVPTL